MDLTPKLRLWKELDPLVKAYDKYFTAAVLNDTNNQLDEAIRNYSSAHAVLAHGIKLCSVAFLEANNGPLSSDNMAKLILDKTVVFPIIPSEAIGSVATGFKAQCDIIYARVQQLAEARSNSTGRILNSFDSETASMAVDSLEFREDRPLSDFADNSGSAPPAVTFQDIIGQDKARATIESFLTTLSIAYLNLTKYTQLSLMDRNVIRELSNQLKNSGYLSVLLFGPPGTGKTSFAYASFTELRSKLPSEPIEFYKIDRTVFRSSYHGESEKAVKQFIKAIAVQREKATLIILLEEIDSLASDRDTPGGSEVSKTIAIELFTGIESLDETKKPTSKPIVFIFTSNVYHKLDEAFVRRVKNKVFVNVPHSIKEMLLVAQLAAKKNLASFVHTQDTKEELEKINGLNERREVLSKRGILVSQADIQSTIATLAKNFNGAVVMAVVNNSSIHVNFRDVGPDIQKAVLYSASVPKLIDAHDAMKNGQTVSLVIPNVEEAENLCLCSKVNPALPLKRESLEEGVVCKWPLDLLEALDKLLTFKEASGPITFG